MVEKKSGPARPPVIDGNVRKKPGEEGANVKGTPDSQQTGSAQRPGSEPGQTENQSASTGQPERTAPSDRASTASGAQTGPEPSIGIPTALGVGLGGAVLGAALSYGAAFLGYWPQQAGQTDGMAPIEERIVQIEAAAAQNQEGLGRIDERFAALESAPVPEAARDLQAREAIDVLQAHMDTSGQTLSELASALETLSERVTPLLGASMSDGEDNGALAATLDGVDARIAALAAQVEALEADERAVTDTLEIVLSRLEALEAEIAARPDLEALVSEQEILAQLARTTTRLEADIAAGRPFASTLSELEALRPDVEITDALRTAAISGLPRREQIVRAYRERLPETLAARPTDPDAGPLDSLLGQAQSALALRPAGEVEGDTPDALLARFEARLEQGDYDAALDIAGQLPEPMQEIIGSVLENIETRLGAVAYLEAVRTNVPRFVPTDSTPETEASQ